jgi:hypothetical protein
MNSGNAHRFVPQHPGLVACARSVVQHDQVSGIADGTLTVTGFELA